jgi:hypothetical protein
LEIRQTNDFPPWKNQQRDYLGILEVQFNQVIKAQFSEGDATFQDNNAPIYTAGIDKKIAR